MHAALQQHVMSNMHDRQNLSVGAAVRLQGWHLRRSVSKFNEVCRRPHLPREKFLQDMMVELGISIASKRAPEDSAEESDDTCFEEGEEEAEFSDDDIVDPAAED